MTEVEKDNFQSVFQRAAGVHPDCTLGLMVDKLDTWLIQAERKGYSDNIRANISNAGGFWYKQLWVCISPSTNV